MITFSMLPGVETSLYLLVFSGLGAGVISGFTGVGGGFLVTPVLVILGLPANMAVGTSLAWVAGNSVVGAIRHGRLGNVDMRLGLVVVLAATAGMEVGVRILNRASDAEVVDEGVLAVALAILLAVGTYTLRESMARKRDLDRELRGEAGKTATKGRSLAERLQRISVPPRLYSSRSGVSISLWVVLGVGFAVGVLAGVIGVGGGFIMVPTLVYVFGVPSVVGAGTSLFQTAVSSSYGLVRHSMSGNVIIFASFTMLVASSIGVQSGVMATRYVRGVSVRYILAICILLSAAGTALKLAGVLLGEGAEWSGMASLIVAFGGLGLGVVMVLSLLVIGIRYRKGRSVPAWARSLVVDAAD